MAKVSFSAKWNTSTNADFRALGSTVSSAFQTVLVKTTDTGQINWSTATNPSANVVAGYEIYRFNDSLQSTAPIFLKIEYGMSESDGWPALWLTIGKGSNGAGSITNVLFARARIKAGMVSVASPGYMSNADGACLSVLYSSASPGGNSHGGYLLIERSRDVNGYATGDALLVSYLAAVGASVVTNVIDYAGGSIVAPPNGIWFAPFDLTTNVSLGFGATTPFFTLCAISSAGVMWTPRGAVGVARANLGAGSVVSNMFTGMDYVGGGDSIVKSDSAGNTYASLALVYM